MRSDRSIRSALRVSLISDVSVEGGGLCARCVSRDDAAFSSSCVPQSVTRHPLHSVKQAVTSSTAVTAFDAVAFNLTNNF